MPHIFRAIKKSAARHLGSGSHVKAHKPEDDPIHSLSSGLHKQLTLISTVNNFNNPNEVSKPEPEPKPELELVPEPEPIPEPVPAPHVPNAATKVFENDLIMRIIISFVNVDVSGSGWRFRHQSLKNLSATHYSITNAARSHLFEHVRIGTLTKWNGLFIAMTTCPEFRDCVKFLVFENPSERVPQAQQLMLRNSARDGMRDQGRVRDLLPRVHTITLSTYALVDLDLLTWLPSLKCLKVVWEHVRRMYVNHNNDGNDENENPRSPLKLEMLEIDLTSMDRMFPRTSLNPSIDLNGWLGTSGVLMYLRKLTLTPARMRDYFEFRPIVAACPQLEHLCIRGLKDMRFGLYGPQHNEKLPLGAYKQIALHSKSLKSLTFDSPFQHEFTLALTDLLNGSHLPLLCRLHVIAFHLERSPCFSLLRSITEATCGRIGADLENLTERLEDRLMGRMEAIHVEFLCPPLIGEEKFRENFGVANRPDVLKITWQPGQRGEIHSV